MQPQLKSGVKSTEFYVMIVSQVVGLAVLSGHVAPEEADSLSKAIVDVIGAVIVLASAVSYIWGRVQLKKELIKMSVSSPIESIATPQV